MGDLSSPSWVIDAVIVLVGGREHAAGDKSARHARSQNGIGMHDWRSQQMNGLSSTGAHLKHCADTPGNGEAADTINLVSIMRG